MNVVLLHDWLTGYRGGERILEVFCEIFPDAPIYTLLHKKGSTSPIIESREIITSFLDKIPNIYEKYPLYLPLMPIATERLKIQHKADLILSSSHCVIKGVRKPVGSKHICYIHSPMRYMYDQFENYFSRAPQYQKFAAHLIRPALQLWDRQSNQNVDKFIANSDFVASRIKSFYGENSTTIHPFVDLDDSLFFSAFEKNDYYVMVTAFAPNKRVDLAISAFNQNGKKLKIIGGGSESETRSLRQSANKNIEFLGKLERRELLSVLGQAKALIYPGVEDFGIVPLESLAIGTPVIAYKCGGVLETLNNETAVFFSGPTVQSLNEAVSSFNSKNFRTEALKQRAGLFTKNKFIEEIKASIIDLCHE